MIHRQSQDVASSGPLYILPIRRVLTSRTFMGFAQDVLLRDELQDALPAGNIPASSSVFRASGSKNVWVLGAHRSSKRNSAPIAAAKRAARRFSNTAGSVGGGGFRSRTRSRRPRPDCRDPLIFVFLRSHAISVYLAPLVPDPVGPPTRHSATTGATAAAMLQSGGSTPPHANYASFPRASECYLTGWSRRRRIPRRSCS